jgi:uncharacterized tellurite resistance protein B-like protein
MFNKLRHFITALNQGNSEVIENKASLEIACAVLLIEVMRADGQLEHSEQHQIATLLQDYFNLTTTEVNELIDSATLFTEQATDFYQFTSKLNQNYTIEDKIKIVNMLWQVANADGKIAAVEQHTIRKIADLLHLRHNEYLKSKLEIIDKPKR